MSQKGTPIDPEQARRTNQVLWIALMLSQAIYGLVALLVAEPRDGVVAAMPLVLGAVGVASGVGAHLSWRRATGAGRALHAEPVRLADRFRGYLIAWVLDESIAVFGLMLALLGFPSTTWAPFLAAGMALMLVHRPRPA